MNDKQHLDEPWVDSIVAEVRAARAALFAEANFDLHTLCECLRDRQATSGHQVVRLDPRRVGRPAGEAA